MKILITTDLYAVTANGVVTSIKVLCSELRKQGHEVRILTLSESTHSYQDGDVFYVASAPIGLIYPDMRMALTYRGSVIRKILDWKPDVVHSQCEFFTYQFAQRIARKLNIPLIHTYHTLYEQYVPYITHCNWGRRRIVGDFSRVRLRKATHIIAPTQKVASTLREYQMKNPIAVIPSGIYMGLHGQALAEQERSELLRSLNIGENQRIVLSLGRLGTEKNLDEILLYLAPLLTVKNQITMLFVGDGPARNNLEKLAVQLGVVDYVRFAGRVEPTEVWRYYQLGNVFVSASTSETQGLTYLEAAANGLPLVCREDPCLDGVLLNGENGFTYTQKTEFQKHIQYVLRDSQWCEAAKGHSKAIANQFTGQQFALSVEHLYRGYGT